jgi:murein DD-endopeptidase MepM/ murein hydrolase activator NlpD
LAKNIEVKILGDARPLQRSLATASRSTQDFGKNIDRSARGAVAASGAFGGLSRSLAFASSSFLGGAGLVFALKTSVGAASNLEEQINKTNVVFRSSGKDIVEWSKTTAKSMGIARDEALSFIGTFGNMLVPMGIARGEAAKMSKSLVKLSADMASFNNANPEEVLEALRAGLAGETEPLRRFGVFLNEARIKAEAFRLGLLKGAVDSDKVAAATTRLDIAQAKYNETLKKYGPGTTQVAEASLRVKSAQDAVAKATSGVTGTLTAQQKALATHSIILKDTKDAQGDFARTSDSLANKQRTLSAMVRDTQAAVGKQLMPVVQNITSSMVEWLGKTENQRKLQETLNSVIKTAGAVLRGLKDLIQAMSPVVRTLTNAVGGTKNMFLLLLGLGIAAKLRAIALSLQIVGNQAAIAQTKVGSAGLLGSLTRLKGLGVITIGIILLTEWKSIRGGPIEDFLNLGGRNTPEQNRLFGLPPARPGRPPRTPEPGGGTSARPGPRGRIIGTPGAGTHAQADWQSRNAIDIAAAPGTPVVAVEDGTIIRVSGSDPSGGSHKSGTKVLFGYGVTLQGRTNTYYYAHLDNVTVRQGTRVRKGQVIGSIAHWRGGSAHVHFAQQAGNPLGAQGSVLGAGGSLASTTGTVGGGGSPLTVGTSAAASAGWKGATVATITAAKASVTAQITEARKAIGGIAGPMSDLERVAIGHLKRLREHLHPHMTAADLARTKAAIAKWGKVLKDEITEQTKLAKRAFDLAAKTMLRAFDKETEAGLKARAAPDETPTERLLRERQEARDDAARSRALSEAIASGDAQAIADAEYDIQTAHLERLAATERTAADEKAKTDQEAYQEQRDTQREALQQQLDDWNEWLRKKAKSWNQFWAWVKANPSGGGVIPDFSGAAAGGGVGVPVPTVTGGGGASGWVRANPDGWTQVQPSVATIPVHAPLKPDGGQIVIHNITTLDGKVIYEDWKKHAARDVTRNGGTGIPT